MDEKIEQELRRELLKRARDDDRRLADARAAIADEIAKETGEPVAPLSTQEEEEQARTGNEDTSRLEWKNSEQRAQVLDKAFPAFHRRLLSMLGQSQVASAAERGHVHRLPLSAHQLARAAEQTPEFKALVDELFGIGRDVGWKSDEEPADAAERLSDLIRRSGYYHAVLSDEWRKHELDPPIDDQRIDDQRLAELLHIMSALRPEKYWERITDRLPRWRRVFRHLRLLRGCHFPKDRFDIAGYSIVRLSDQELQKLGPPLGPVGDFYSDESLSAPDFREKESDVWFLERAELRECGHLTQYVECEERASSPDASAGYRLRNSSPQTETKDSALNSDVSVGYNIRPLYGPKELNPIWETREFEISSGVRETAPVDPRQNADFAYPANIAQDLRPILMLTLFRDGFFDLPAYLISETGWRIVWLTRDHTGEQPGGYQVAPRDWADFEEFARLCEAAFRQVFPEWRFLARALWYYLRATFAKGAILQVDEVDNWWDIELAAGRFGREFIQDQVSDMLRRSTEPVAEEVLLHYVFCLEVLLTGDAKEEGIKGRVARSASVLAGRSRKETEDFKEIATDAYELRNDLVHGNELRRLNLIRLLPRLRQLCRHVLAVTLSLALEHPGPEELKKTFEELATSEGLRPKHARSRDRVLSMISWPA
jgi:hypothetical protein